MVEQARRAKARKVTPAFIEMNAKVMPVDRERWEDPLSAMLESRGLGHVSGGGTMLMEDKEIAHSDTELTLFDIRDDDVELIISSLEKLGAPKGSKITFEGMGAPIIFGVNQGLGIYLSGINLKDDALLVSIMKECNARLSPNASIWSSWRGPREAAFYAYGPSYENMVSAVSDYLKSTGAQLRLVQIA